MAESHLTERQNLSARLLIMASQQSLLKYWRSLRRLEMLLNQGKPIDGLDGLMNELASALGDADEVPEDEYRQALEQVLQLLPKPEEPRE